MAENKDIQQLQSEAIEHTTEEKKNDYGRESEQQCSTDQKLKRGLLDSLLEDLDPSPNHVKNADKTLTEDGCAEQEQYFDVIEDEEKPTSEISDELRKALHKAASEGDLDKLEDLLDDPSADINAIWFGESLLMSAIRSKEQQMAEFLIDNGCDVNFVSDRVTVENNKPHSERDKGEEASRCCLMHYSTTAREMAYDKEMLNIVDLIDFKNNCLFPAIKWPLTRAPISRRTPEERGKVCNAAFEETNDEVKEEIDSSDSEEWVGNTVIERRTPISDTVVLSPILKTPRGTSKLSTVTKETRFTEDACSPEVQLSVGARRKVDRTQPVVPLTKSASQRAAYSHRYRKYSDLRYKAEDSTKFPNPLCKQNTNHFSTTGIKQTKNSKLFEPLKQDSQPKTRHVSPFSEDLAFNSVRVMSLQGESTLPNRRTARMQTYINEHARSARSEQQYTSRQLRCEQQRRRVLSAPPRRSQSFGVKSGSNSLLQLRRSVTDLSSSSSMHSFSTSLSELRTASISESTSLKTYSKLSKCNNWTSGSKFSPAKTKVRFSMFS